MQKLVLSSSNKKKIAEIESILGFKPLSAEDVNLPEVEETETTFEGNALLKARAACVYTNLPAIADDSGLCVEALNGAPGIYSGRMEREKGIEWVIDKLKGEPNRNAYFICSIALVYPDGKEYVFEGRMNGKILHERQDGPVNFGYDPIFIAQGKTVSNAKLTLAEKNKISHRGKALSALKNHLLAIS